jgi:hypothetical protein
VVALRQFLRWPWSHRYASRGICIVVIRCWPLLTYSLGASKWALLLGGRRG